MNEKENFKQIIINKDVKTLSKILFKFEPTPKQCEIIRTIAYSEHKRVSINCMTRYGKSDCIALAVCIYLLLNKNKIVIIIAPTYDQANKLRQYLANHMSKNNLFTQLIESEETKGVERYRKEFSKRRVTFKNGNELTIMSAEGSGERLMGFGGDLTILDESCLIKLEVYQQRISRMLGDSPDSILVEATNPWHRNNHAYQHWINKDFYHIHVGWKDALREGRVTQEFLDEQKKQLNKIDWCVLYESQYPEESEDSLISLKFIRESYEAHYKIQVDKINPDEIRRILSCDVADKGHDKTVYTIGFEWRGLFYVDRIIHEDKSENIDVSKRIIRLIGEYSIHDVNIDCIGIGAGVVSYVKRNKPNRNVKIFACHFGTKSTQSTRYSNKKAEMYFKLKELFETRKIVIPEHAELIDNLVEMQWEYSQTTGKIKVIDPEKGSPDFADSLVYFVWKSASYNPSIA